MPRWLRQQVVSRLLSLCVDLKMLVRLVQIALGQIIAGVYASLTLIEAAQFYRLFDQPYGFAAP